MFDKNNYTDSRNFFIQSEMYLYNLLETKINLNDKHNILEIGCFEGLSACYFSDVLLDHPESTLDCVDPFLNDYNLYGGILVKSETENIFDNNIKRSKNFQKIAVHKVTSDTFFDKNEKKFDFIYIDGNHLPEYIQRDMLNALKCIKKDGIIWMDDYGGGGGTGKIAMDEIIDKYKDNIEIIHKGYQLAFKVINMI